MFARRSLWACVRHGLWPVAAACPLLFGLLACTTPTPISIAPADMIPTASALNHPAGQSYVLVEDATVTARVKFTGVQRWGLSITARAEPAADGAWPHLRVELDGAPTHTLVIADAREIPYWFNFASEPGFAELKLSLVGNPPTQGPVLVIERIEFVPL